MQKLRKLLKAQSLDGFVVPSGDEFQSEFCPDHARRLEWLTGFSGSNGIAVILHDKCAFFTDGRYSLQAQDEVSSEYEIHNLADETPGKWLARNLSKDKKIAIDAKLHSVNSVKAYGDFVCVEQNPVDEIWTDRPRAIKSDVVEHSLKYSGVDAADKIAKISQELKKKSIDTVVLTSPESVCWLLNIRGADLSCTPAILATAIIFADGEVQLFVEPERVKCQLAKSVKLLHPNQLQESLSTLSNMKVGLDSASSSYWFLNELRINDAEINNFGDPCVLPKAIKNQTEIDGSFAAHITDGVAVTQFLYWLSNPKNMQNLDELSAQDKLLEFRKKSGEMTMPSFDTIAGFGSNGAIVHYRASKKSCKKIEGNNLFLVDSGGQYKAGTTDITRTIAIGEPSLEHKRSYTLVLKGHISLASVIFPHGTTGAHLDVLARMHLWQQGLDYDHGTGHGVGSFLGVHEGPQNISKALRGVPLQAGMIVSNEPGYYKTGEYGIRIESLVLVVEKPEIGEKGRKFLGFETITRTPLDYRLIDWSMLSELEVAWLESYQQKVERDLADNLPDGCKSWLQNHRK